MSILNETIGFNDHPIELDQMGLKKYADVLSEFIQSANTPLTISIQGDVGSGKTSLLKMIETNLCDKEKINYECIWINTWQFFLNEDDKEAIKKIIIAITNKLIHLANPKMYNYNNLIKEIVNQLRNIFFTKGETILNYLDFDEKSRKQIGDYESFFFIDNLKTSLNKLVKATIESNQKVSKKGFVLFIDELERLDPVTTIKILDVLKNLFDIRYITTIITIDYESIFRGLRRKLGEHSQIEQVCKSYYEKIVQLPFVVPVNKLSVHSFVFNSLKELGYFNPINKEIRDKLNQIIQLTIGNNPRKIKRLMNLLSFSQIVDKSQNGILNDDNYKLINIILIAIQLAYPKLYDVLYYYPDFTAWKESDLVDYIDKDKKYGINLLNKRVSWQKTLSEICLSDYTLEFDQDKILKLFDLLDQELLVHPNKKATIVSILMLSELSHINGSANLDVDSIEIDDIWSNTLFIQGKKLIDKTVCFKNDRVLDIGCGCGEVTIELYKRFPSTIIDAIDLSEDKIKIAKDYRYNETISKGKMNFYQQSPLSIETTNYYDLIFSNASLHMIKDCKSLYRILYQSLRNNGRLAILQGGRDCYKGLHDAARQAIKKLGLTPYFNDWNPPFNYLSKQELESIIIETGFKNLKIIEEESDGNDYPTLVKHFTNNELIAYLEVIPFDRRQSLIEEFQMTCNGDIDHYTHLFYVFATKME